MKSLFLIFFLCYLKNTFATKYGCNFEKYCSDLNIDSFWGLTDGQHPFTPNYPNIDHTYKNSSGHYVFFNYDAGQKFKDATIDFYQLYNTTSSNVKLILTFSYVIIGSKSVNLSLMLIQGDSEDLKSTWLKVNTFSNKTTNWQTVKIDLPKDIYRIRLSVDSSRLNSNNGIVLALDDIFVDEIKDNSLENPLAFYCDFEVDDCSFNNRMPLNWSRVQGAESVQQPNFDHTLNSSNGFFLTSNQSRPGVPGLMQRIVTQTITVPQSDTSFCLHFYYFFKAYNARLYIYAQPVDEDGDDKYKQGYLVWPPDTNLGLSFVYNEWSWAIAELIPGNYKVSFIYSTQDGYSTSVSIDDIKVSSCPAVNNRRTEYLLNAYFEFKCDFELDDCGFGDVIPYDDVPTNWTRAIASSGYTYDPPVDHTMSNSSGHYYKVNYTYPFVSRFVASAQSVNVFSSIQHCVQFYFYSDAEAFNQKIQATFGIGSGGCYGATLYYTSPFNSSDNASQWVKVIVNFKGFSCSEFMIFGFSTSDFLRFGIAIDDITIDRCDLLPPDDVTTTTIVTTSTSKTTTVPTTTISSTTKPTTTQITTTLITTTQQISAETVEILTTSNSTIHSTTHKNNAHLLRFDLYLVILTFLFL